MIINETPNDEGKFLQAAKLIAESNDCEIEFDYEHNVISFSGNEEDCVTCYLELKDMFPNNLMQ